MAKQFYDLAASAERVESSKQAVMSQRQYITSLADETKCNAVRQLRTLENDLEISEKTHALILELLRERQIN